MELFDCSATEFSFYLYEHISNVIGFVCVCYVHVVLCILLLCIVLCMLLSCVCCVVAIAMYIAMCLHSFVFLARRNGHG